jgi:hypothetical protein
LPAGWTLSGTVGVTTSSNNPSPLEGYDMAGIPIVVRHQGATMRNLITGNNGAYSSTQGSHIRLGNSNGQDWSFFTIEDCLMIGGGNAITDAPSAVAIYSTHTAPADFRFGVIRRNFISGFRGDCIEMNAAGDLLIEDLYLGPSGWKPSALVDRIWPHADWMTLGNAENAAGPITIRRVFIEAPQRTGVFGRTSYLNRASASTVDMSIDRSIMIGASDWGMIAGDSEATDNSAFQYPFGGGATAGAYAITNSALDRHPTRTWVHPSATAPGTFTGNLTWADGSAAALP